MPAYDHTSLLLNLCLDVPEIFEIQDFVADVMPNAQPPVVAPWSDECTPEMVGMTEKEYEAALVFVKQYKAKAKVTILDGRLKFMRMKKDAFAEGRLLVRGWGTRTWKEWRIGLKTEEGMKLAGFDVF